MELQTWIYYALAVLVLTASPGPMVLLCITTSVKEGFSPSVYIAFGGLIAIVGILTLSFTGLGVIVMSSQILFDTIKYLGAGYLIYLGYLGYKAFTSKQENFDFSNKIELQSKDKYKLFIKGFITGFSNPKALVFFIALLPQFINPNNPLLIQYLILVTTFAIPEIAWLLFYSYMGAKSSKWFLQNGRAKFFNRITGGIFVGAGLILSNTNKS